VLDQDLIIDLEGGEILLAEGQSIVALIIIKETKGGEILQPEAIFVNSAGQQYIQPLRYVYFETQEKFIDFGSGLEAGVFLFPTIATRSNSEVDLNPIGAALYLSERTVNSRLARYFLFNEESDSFKLVHTQENIFVESLKQQGAEVNHFAYFNQVGLQGPIKIWEINYPSGIKSNPVWLELDFPDERLNLPLEGKY